MENLRISQGQANYDVVFASDPLQWIEPDDLIVTDQNLYTLYGHRLAGCSCHVLVPGETGKTLDSAGRLARWMMEKQADRGSRLVALGGGAVSDLVGFTAAIYMRGCRWTAIPTTLLAMVDAAVGGKTAVNLDGVKNLMGAFYPPESVWIDEAWLETLPSEQWQSGLGEVLKYAFLDQNVYETVLAGDPEPIQMIRQCLAVKKRYVEADPMDTGIRMHLNLGHTYGHALETEYRLPHGVSVAMGIRMVIERYGTEDMLSEFKRLVSALQLVVPDSPADRGWEARVAHDKKRGGDILRIVVPESIGTARVMEVSDAF